MSSFEILGLANILLDNSFFNDFKKSNKKSDDRNLIL